MNAAASKYKPGLDLVIVNYQTAMDLRDCLASLVEVAPTVDYDLTLVNVSPLPADKLVLKDWERKAKITTYLEYSKNVGYARAVNAGLRDGQREVCVALNADILFLPDALELCHQALMAHDDWGVLGPRQIDDRGRFTHAGIFGTNTRPRHRGWHEANQGQHQDVQDAVTVAGSAYFVKRSLWEELTACPVYQDFCGSEGAFLPTNHYYEETWCSYHAASHGARVMYYGEATLVHRWHRASPVGGAADQQMSASRTLFRAACDAHGIPRD
jgi:GT2 family glycosyltransferase